MTSELDERARTQDDKPGRRKEDLRAAVVIMGTAAGLVFEYHVGPEKH